MELKHIAEIFSGNITRGKIHFSDNGSHFLLQAKDVNPDQALLAFQPGRLMRFFPVLSRKDCILQSDDLLFMARGARHYTVRLATAPEPALAAACFFIIRITDPAVRPGFVCWYLNQEPARQFFFRNSGRGVNMPVVRRAVLENVDVPLPSLHVQEAVAHLGLDLEKERMLMQQHMEKRNALANRICMQAVHKNMAGDVR